MKSSIFAISAFAAIGLSAPLKRTTYGPSDADILNYALTLEHLENAFYRDGLAKFDVANFKANGSDEATYGRVKTIASDEATHVEFLTGALTAAGAKPVAECTYNFGYTDVKSFLATAAVLEGVGVSAYLGAAASIVSKTYLTAAGSILTVEARHAAYIRNQIGQEPFPQPFDNPLSLNSVFTLAAQFIVKCPEDNPALPVKAFPVLAATSKDTPIKTGSTLTLAATGLHYHGHVFAAFITVTGPVFVEVKWAEGGYEVVVPKGIAGQSYLVLTKSDTAATDDTILAGPAIVEIVAA